MWAQVLVTCNIILKYLFRVLAFKELLDKLKFENYEINGVEHIQELVEISNNILKICINFDENSVRNKKIKIVLGDGRKGLIENSPFDFIHV
jgi:protein-L-isoaspartate O-methyltransferase